MRDHDDDPDLRLPEALQRDLRAALGSQVRIPERIEVELFAAARRRRMRPLWRQPALWAAAALLLTVTLWTRLQHAAAPASQMPLAREDYDGNGRVDVLDAFRMSLALQRGEVVPARFDLDGDGRVDAPDVERIAAAAVRLRG